MPETDSQEPANNDVERLFLQKVVPAIPKVVGQVFAKLGRHPDPMDVDRFVQRIRVLLWENDYQALRSFKRESLLETWLFTIAWRNIRRWFRERDGIVSLDDMPPGSFTVQPAAEESLLAKEMEERLRAAKSKLTRRERKLFELCQDGLSNEEIAEKMKIKKKTVSTRKSALMKKIQRLVRDE